jgi:hypothetical protein
MFPVVRAYRPFGTRLLFRLPTPHLRMGLMNAIAGATEPDGSIPLS